MDIRLDLPKDREFEAGIWYTTPSSTWYPAHYHDELELNLVIRGHAIIRVANQELTLRAGALLWLAPGQGHAMVAVSPDYAMWVVSIRPDAVRNVERSSGARLSDRARSWGECRVSGERFRTLASLLSSSPSHGGAADENRLSRRILANAIETWGAHERLRSTSNADYRAVSHGPHEAIVRAEALLRGTDAKVPLAALARSCGVSESRLSHVFKAQLGSSTSGVRDGGSDARNDTGARDATVEGSSATDGGAMGDGEGGGASSGSVATGGASSGAGTGMATGAAGTTTSDAGSTGSGTTGSTSSSSGPTTGGMTAGTSTGGTGSASAGSATGTTSTAGTGTSTQGNSSGVTTSGNPATTANSAAVGDAGTDGGGCACSVGRPSRQPQWLNVPLIVVALGRRRMRNAARLWRTGARRTRNRSCTRVAWVGAALVATLGIAGGCDGRIGDSGPYDAPDTSAGSATGGPNPSASTGGLGGGGGPSGSNSAGGATTTSVSTGTATGGGGGLTDTASSGATSATATGTADTTGTTTASSTSSTTSSTGGTVSCQSAQAAVVRMQTLSTTQYTHTVQDLFQITSDPGKTLDDKIFDALDDGRVTARADAAASVAHDAVAILSKWAPCAAPTTGDATACENQFIDKIGTRIFRRALTTDDKTQMKVVFDAGIKAKDFSTGVEWFLTAVLGSPDFLYEIAKPDPSETPGQVRPLAAYEYATKLAQFIWDSTPDDTLLSAAASSDLTDVAKATVQINRLMQDTTKAMRGVEHFYGRWLNLNSFNELARDAAGFDTSVAQSLATSLLMSATQLYGSASPNLSSLFSGESYYMNDVLRKFYGLSGTSTSFTQVTASGEGRRGILTHPALMAAQARPEVSFPIGRGLFIVRNLLCLDPAPPPANLVIPQLATPSSGVSTRDTVEAHTKTEPCATCHKVFDPPGFALENFDEVGKYRTTDHGTPVRTSDTMAVGKDVDGVFATGDELLSKLATSNDVRACFASQYLEVALSRDRLLPEDACSADALAKAFIPSGDLKQLVVAVATSDAFRLRLAEGVAK